MKFLRRYRHHLFLLCLVVFLQACETNGTSSDLKLIGNPPNTMYYGSPFAFQFGVSGGTGQYRYRYLNETPEGFGFEQEIDPEPNPIEMSIEVSDDAKSSFWLRGVPEVPSDVSFESLGRKTLRYYIEVSDGDSTIVREFEFNLEKVSLISGTDITTATENIMRTSTASSLIRSAQNGSDAVCRTVRETAYEEATLPNGVRVLPTTFSVRLESPLASQVEIFYRPVSSYITTEGERDESNIGLARPNVDFIQEDHSIIFEPGQRVCVAHVNIIDDLTIEDREEFSIEFFERIGGGVDLGGSTIAVRINDNETLPDYLPVNTIINEGGVVTIPIHLNTAQDNDVRVNVSVDSELTTAQASDFELVPNDGVVLIPEGATEGSFSVRALVDEDSSAEGLDDRVVINTDIQHILEYDPIEIVINEWGLDDALQGEVVARETEQEEAIDLEVGSTGNVYVLSQGVSQFGNTRLQVSGFQKNSDRLDLQPTGDILVERNGLDVLPKSLLVSDYQDGDLITVVFEVTAQFANVHRGGRDYVVEHYAVDNSGYFVRLAQYQFGTESDDFVTGTAKGDADTFYVFGSTLGLDFDGVPGSETNYGGYDGFISKLSVDSNTPLWSRFIGREKNESVLGVDATRGELFALTEVSEQPKNAFIRTLESLNLSGSDSDSVNDIDITSDFDAFYADIELNENGTDYYVVGSSRSAVPVNTPTESNSEDAFLLRYGVDGERSTRVGIATTLFDKGVGLAQLSDHESLIVAGFTEGIFEGQVSKGDVDGFVRAFDVEAQNVPEEIATTQFGTLSDDVVIDVVAAGKDKYMVLWSEEFSSGNNTKRYRVSPFSAAGKKLTLDPAEITP